MFDHVGLYLSDFAAAARAYRPLFEALDAEPPSEDEGLIEWEDLALSPANPERPVTSAVHIGLVAPSREHVDRFWRAGLEAGLTDDGAPGPRAVYGPDYYGGFLLDADGNSIEACLHARVHQPGRVDHVWLRVADVAASRDFYAAIAPWTGFRLVVDEPGLARFRGPQSSFTVTAGERRSAHLHVAFPTDQDAVVEGFHAAAMAAGFRDNGGPGERSQYHPGYYGAFVLDPDGHNIEVVNHRSSG
jgi:catechol 2,3-dioxygenase-like lactoylglutathione lyase family enzyme